MHMENHKRVVDLALSFDAVIFGGYVRDVVICQQEKFNDIDILWSNTIHNSFETFVRVLSLEPWVDTLRTDKESNKRYSNNLAIVKIIINEDLHLDCVIYPGTFTYWLNERDCDFTCNIFYMSRTTNLAIRYIPDSLKFTTNPFKECFELTKQKKFKTILDKTSERYWARACARALNLVKSGWIVEGKIIPYQYSCYIEGSFKSIGVHIKLMKRIMNNQALDIIAPNINESCKERVRRNLFDGDSELSGSSDDESTGQTSEQESHTN